MKILTAAQMGEVDRLSTERYKIPSLLLMENAGRSAAERLLSTVSRIERKKIIILCGRGNNGGDGFVVARYLAVQGATPEIVLLADPSHIRGDALINWQIVQAMGIGCTIFPKPAEAVSHLERGPTPDIIIDALFGTGLSKPIGPDLQPAVDWVNQVRSRTFVFAVDMPSGLYADSHLVPGTAVKAHLTVTFTAPKVSLVVPPSADYAGKVYVASIGSPPSLLENSEYNLNLIDGEQVRRSLPPRKRQSHKGSYGHVFVVAGSRGKSGAALMAGLAALRAGAGLVTLWLPEGLQHDVVGKFPELMTEFLPQTGEGTTDLSAIAPFLQRAADADALILGPGMSTNVSTRQLIHEIVRRSPVPVVIDADGLNAFADNVTALRNEEGQALVLTPHPGEMARLTGLSIPEIQADRLETARKFSKEHACFTILKGFQTVVATPGGAIYISNTGNAGMATGGTGDILAGIVGRFVLAWTRKLSLKEPDALAEYLSAAVYLHGLAGDLAAEEKGQESLIATDLLSMLPAAFKIAAHGEPGSPARSGISSWAGRDLCLSALAEETALESRIGRAERTKRNPKLI